MKSILASRSTSLVIAHLTLGLASFGCDSAKHGQTDDPATLADAGHDGTVDGSVPDGGDPGQDGGAHTDGGAHVDGGSPEDAGVDAGALLDSGLAPRDAGALDASVDAGKPDAAVDAGEPLDAAVDAGEQLDAAVDAGEQLDAAVDAGEPLDAAVDAGASADASTCTQKVDECGVCGGYGLWWWYPDVDGDGFGEPSGGVRACEPPDGYVWSTYDPDPACPNREKELFLATTQDATVSSLHPEPGWGTRLSTWGAESRLVGSSREVTRSYIKFDLSPLSRDAKVLYAGIGLYLPSDLETDIPVGDNRGKLDGVREPWDEQTLSWDHQPRSANDPQHLFQTSGFSSWGLDVTEELSSQHLYPDYYTGFVLTREDEGSDGILRFASKEHPDSSVHTDLRVLYVDSESESCSLCRGLGRRVLYRDVDGDGLGDAAQGRFFCADEDSTGFVRDSSDRQPLCPTNDQDVCGVCAGPGSVAYYRDVDGDGLGDASTLLRACSPPDGYVLVAGDPEPLCATNDQDDCGVCAGPGPVDLYEDADGDGLGTSGVIDHGCVRSGYADNDDDPEPTCPTNDTHECGQCGGPHIVAWYEDKDGDGLGDPSSNVQACSPPAGYVANDDDPDPSCFSMLGDVTILEAAEFAKLTDVCEVTGKLVVNAPDLQTMRLDKLRSVGSLQVSPGVPMTIELPELVAAREVSIFDNGKLLALRLPKLEETHRFVVPLAPEFDLPKLRNVSEWLQIGWRSEDWQGPAEMSILPALQSVKYAFIIANGPPPDDIRGVGPVLTLPALSEVSEHLLVQEVADVRLPALVSGMDLSFYWCSSVALPVLEEARALAVTGGGFVSVQAPSLRLVHAGTMVAGFEGYSVQMGALESTGELSLYNGTNNIVADRDLHAIDVDLSRLARVDSAQLTGGANGPLQLPSLVAVAKDLWFEGGSFALDALTDVGGNVLIGRAGSWQADLAPSVGALSMQRLKRVGGALVAERTALDVLSLPSLESIGSFGKNSLGFDAMLSLAVRQAPNLAQLAFPTLAQVAGTLDFRDTPALDPCIVEALRAQLGLATNGSCPSPID